MRILGIDYGSKRVGVALSDETGRFAMPLLVVKNGKSLLEEIVGLAKTNEVKEIVLATSRRMHDRMPNEMNGKPVRVVVLSTGAF